MTIKLPDFLYPGPLESVRREMGAPLAEYRVLVEAPPPIELPILPALIGAGIDVELGDVERLPDGTLAYKGHRVLVYIRDLAQYGHHQSMPKYHVAYCQTLDKMRANNRFARYVVASRDDGLFVVNLVGDLPRSELVRLDVCQNCLATLEWSDFSFDLKRETRLVRVAEFRLVEFFARFPRDLLAVRPPDDSDTGPLNDYPPNWPQVSSRTKRVREYRCEACGYTASETSASRFLHVHHADGRKNNCADSNLRVLCIGCHAEEPMHAHMRATRDYEDFIRIHGARRGGR